MEENKNLPEVDEAVAEVDTSGMDNNELKTAINETLERIRTQAMVLGYRTACMTIMQMLSPCFKQHLSYRDYERIVKQVNAFCAKGLKQPEKTEEVAEETVQN